MSNRMLVFSGRSNTKFTNSIVANMGMELGRLEVVRFSDGELSVEIGDNVRGNDIFVVQSTSAPGNDHIMELLIVLDALKRASARRITAVIPYFGYSRQDRKTRSRVPITAKLVADLITTAGANRVLTMDLHAGQIMGFFNIPVDNLYAMQVLLRHVQSKWGGEDLIVVSPDAGGVERARHAANSLGGVELAVIDKYRVAPNKVSEMRVIGNVKDKTCLIIDDIVDTAGTLTKAGNTVLAQGAKRVIACCVHPVLSGNASDVLSKSNFEEIVVSDTIAIPPTFKCDRITVVSVAPLFAEAIRRIHDEESVSELFK